MQSIINQFYENKKIRTSRVQLFTLYILVYGGYIKLFFPKIATGIGILQIGFAALSILSIGKIHIYLGKQIRAFMYMFISIILMSFSYLYTNNQNIGKGRLFSCILIIAYMGVIYVIASRLTLDKTERLVHLFIKINNCVIMLYFLLYLSSFVSNLQIGGRLGDVVGNSIWLGRLCTEQVLLMLVFNRWVLTLPKKLMFFFLLIICVMTGSKGPIISVIIVIAIYYLFNTDMIRKKILTILLIAISFTIVIYIISNTTNTFITNRFSLDTMLTRNQGYRLSRYIYTISKIPEKIIEGHGLGSWSTYYWGSFGIVSTTNDYPHNIILEMLFECGVVMTIFWLLSIIKLRSIFKYFKRERVYLLFLLLLLNILFGMFSGSIIDGNRGIYYYLAICVGVCRELNGKTQKRVFCS